MITIGTPDTTERWWVEMFTPHTVACWRHKSRLHDPQRITDMLALSTLKEMAEKRGDNLCEVHL